MRCTLNMRSWRMSVVCSGSPYEAPHITEQTVDAQCLHLLDTQSVVAHHCLTLVVPLVAWSHQQGAAFEHRLVQAVIILPCKNACVSPSTRTAHHNAAGSWGLGTASGV